MPPGIPQVQLAASYAPLYRKSWELPGLVGNSAAGNIAENIIKNITGKYARKYAGKYSGEI